MPQTKSAKKALRQSRKRFLRNRVVKQNLKSALKKVAGENLPEIFSAIDKAAQKRIIPKNKAARLKSRLSQKLTLK
ncbi:30S ribosomal protein S20 [Candidatus Berkelbacteria bacterium]|nr:30S ribosomal protein S20 [Candidatus Berkelbacteria bacterium]